MWQRRSDLVMAHRPYLGAEVYPKYVSPSPPPTSTRRSSMGDQPHRSFLAGPIPFDRVRPVPVGTRRVGIVPEVPMLRWALIFLIIALVAAALGFGGIAATAAGIAKILFYIFLVLFLIALIAGLAAGRKISP